MSHRTLAGVALVALAALSWKAPVSGQTPAAPASPGPSPAPIVLPTPVAVPSPITSLPPASSAEALPYPAYGTPVPGVNRGVPAPGIPQIVSIDQAVAIGFAKSPLLAQARASVLVDAAPVDLAQTAVLPNISGTATGGRSYRQNSGEAQTSNNTGSGGSSTNGGGTGSVTVTTFGPAYSTSTLSVTLKQLVYDGGKVAAQLHEAKATYNSSILTYKRQLQTVAYNVANAYYAALAAQRATQVAAETVKIDQVNANLVAAQIRAGTAARSDYLTAELPVAQARVTLVRDQYQELSAQAVLVNAMGLDANTYVLPQDDGNVLAGSASPAQIPTPSYDAAIARALLLRPDYYAAQQSVLSYQYALKAARLGLVPNLNLSGSYGTSSDSPQGGDFRNSGTVGLTLSVPIFDQGITHAQVEQAQGQLDLANATLQTTLQSVQLNVKQTLLALVSAQSAFVETQAELANAREVLQATQAQYAAGVTTLPLLLNAQVGLTTALADQVNAVYALRQAEAAFLYAEGANAPS